MASASSSRVEAPVAELAGFATIVLFVLSILATPSTAILGSAHSPDALAKAYSLHRFWVLASGWIGALTWGLVFLTFAGALSAYLSGRGRSSATCAWVGLAGAAAESLAILVVILLSQAAAFTAESIEPAVLLLLHQSALLANNLSGFPTIVCVAAYTLGLRRADSLPSWVLGLAGLCIAAHASSTISLASQGFAAPSGPASLVAPFTMAGWVLGVSIVLRRQRRAAQQSAAADEPQRVPIVP
jgi:hypothetical protein